MGTQVEEIDQTLLVHAKRTELNQDYGCNLQATIQPQKYDHALDTV